MKKKILIVVLILVLCLGATGVDTVRFSYHPKTTITMLNIGQGDAFYIRLNTGEDMLIDAGSNPDRVLRELRSVMPWWDHELSAVVLSHPDSDHIGGFSGVFGAYTVQQAFDCGYRDKATTAVRLVYEGITKHAISLNAIYAGERIDLSDNVWFDVLSPHEGERYTSDSSNECSLVMLFHDHNATMLFTGDASIGIEENILKKYSVAMLDVDVLKVGHHGSKNSTSDTWLDALNPEVAFISAGLNNHYHHPHPTVTRKLDQRGIQTFLTLRDGRIQCESDQDAFMCAPQ